VVAGEQLRFAEKTEKFSQKFVTTPRGNTVKKSYTSGDNILCDIVRLQTIFLQ
jgi:hypothetical protein